MIVIIALCIVAWLIYGPLTEWLLDLFELRSVYHGDVTRCAITLTFDDGPDPAYTPRLLALLKEYRVPAVFFVVGEKALAHPELIRQIHDEGHRIGSHTYRHRNSWLTPPWRLAAELAKTNRILENITGEKVQYFRPPWGRLTLWTHALCRRLGMTTVLWSLAAKDWRTNERPDTLVRRLASEIGNGAIVLLHDASGTVGAPERMLEALRLWLPRLRESGLTCSLDPIDDGAAGVLEPAFRYTRVSQRLIIPLWLVWERYFNRKYHVYPLTRLFRMSVVPWHYGERQAAVGSASGAASGAAPGTAPGTAPGATSGATFGSGRRETARASKPLDARMTAEAEWLQGADEAAAATSNRLAGGSATDVAPPNSNVHPGAGWVAIKNGDPMVELHMQNATLQEFVHIESPERMAVYSLRVLRESLRDVARLLLVDDRFQAVKGVFGMTLLHVGAERMGFHMEDVEPTLMNRWVSGLLVFLMVLYHPQGRKRLHSGLHGLRPKLVWMTREELLARYPTS